MAEIHLIGRAASPGLAIGPVTCWPLPWRRGRRAAIPRRRRQRCRRRSKARGRRSPELIETVQGEAADILEFQVAMLEDDALADAAYEAISAGTAADHAWRSALDAEIAGYRAAEDEYFRARAADLVDIRDRVLAHLSGVRHGRQDCRRLDRCGRRHHAFAPFLPPTGRAAAPSRWPRAHLPRMSRCWRGRAGRRWSSGSVRCRGTGSHRRWRWSTAMRAA